MSYVRMGPDSDVYVYGHIDGGFECCGCRLYHEYHRTKTRQGMLAHLRVHIAAGHKVPIRALIRLRVEAGEVELRGYERTLDEQQYWQMLAEEESV